MNATVNLDRLIEFQILAANHTNSKSSLKNVADLHTTQKSGQQSVTALQTKPYAVLQNVADLQTKPYAALQHIPGLEKRTGMKKCKIWKVLGGMEDGILSFSFCWGRER